MVGENKGLYCLCLNMYSHGSEESVFSCPSSFSDQEFHIFGEVSLDNTHPAGDSDNNLKVPSPTSFNGMGAIHEAASTVSGITAARRTLASAVVNRSAKILDEERRNRLLDLVCLNFKMLEKQLENTLSRAEAKSQVAELESLTTSLQDRMMEIGSINDKQAYPMQTPRVAARVPRSLTMKTGKTHFDDGRVQKVHDTDLWTPQCSNERFLAEMTETKKEQDHAEDLDHMIPPHNTDLEATDISYAQQSGQILKETGYKVHDVHTDLPRTQRLKESMGPNNHNNVHSWLSKQDLSVNSRDPGKKSHITKEDFQTRGRDPNLSNKFGRNASDTTYQRKLSFSNQNRKAANNRDTPRQDEQQTGKQQPCLQQPRNHSKMTHEGEQRYTRKRIFSQQSGNPAKQNETRPTTGQPSPQDIAHTGASSDTTRHDQQDETRPTKDRSTSQYTTRAEASSDITCQGEERYNLTTYSHREDKDTRRPFREESVSRYSRGALTHSDMISQDDQTPSSESSSGKSRRNTNYSDSKYKCETIPIRKHSTHGRSALSDSYITHTEEKGDLGPSHERSHHASTSLITNKVTSMPPRQKSSPRHSGIPGKISHLEPTSKHDFHQMGESRFIYQETPRDRRSLQSNYDHMSTDVTTNLSRAQSQHNINQVPIDKDIVTDKSCQSAQGLLDISKAADDVVRERRENLRIIPQNIVKRMSIAFE